MPYRKIISITYEMPAQTKGLVFILALFTPLLVCINVIMFLVIVDMVTSIFYQMQQVPKDASFYRHVLDCLRVIESRKLRLTVSKLLFYIVALMAFFLFDRFLLKIEPLEGDVLATFSVTNLAAILIGITELTSIASNISRITNNPIFHTIMLIFGKKVHDKLNIEYHENITEQKDHDKFQPV